MSDYDYTVRKAQTMNVNELKYNLNIYRDQIKMNANDKRESYNELNKYKARKQNIQNNINALLTNKKNIEVRISNLRSEMSKLNTETNFAIESKRGEYNQFQIRNNIEKHKELKLDLNNEINARKQCISTLKSLFEQKNEATEAIKGCISAIQSHKNLLAHNIECRNIYRDMLKSKSKHERYQRHASKNSSTYDSDDNDTYQSIQFDSKHVEDPYGNGVYDGIYDDYE